MEAQLQEDDLVAWLDAVERYARQELAPRCTQSDIPLSHSSVREVINGLIDLGVLNLGLEPAGGLWDRDDDPLLRRLAVSTLHALAQYSASVAYQVHGQALACRLDRWAGVRTDGLALVSLQGSQGLGRDAVVQVLAAQPLSGVQQAVMADNWGWPTEPAPRYLHGLDDWQAVWMPVWDAQRSWHWHRLPRTAVKVVTLKYSHGVDELSTQQIWMTTDQVAQAQSASASLQSLQGREAQAAWHACQAMHTVGLQAISQAVVQRAWALAQDYAALRRQGGQTIVTHVAVQQLLGRARNAVRESEQALTHVGTASCAWPDLPARWRDRVRCQLSLSHGASAALQVFGGMGYMRDNAMEKALRDVNHLRLLGGSPAELSLCVNHWDAFLADHVPHLCGESA